MKQVRDILRSGATPDSPSGKWGLWLGVLLALIAMAVTFHYYTRIKPRLDPSNFYAMQGEAFLGGHTYLKLEPSPQLLALKDPYDPATNLPYLLWDASLYNGKYYLYFGGAPALLWAAVKAATGIALTDPQLVLGFTCLATGCLVVLLALTALHERMVTGVGLAPAILALTLGTWIPFMLRRPSFYEVAVSGAYCFSAMGMLLLWKAIDGERSRRMFAALASLSLGIAIGCRPTYVLSIVPLTIALLYMFHPLPLPKRLVTLFLLCIPWGCCLLGVLIYNYERFGSPFESGWHYQLTYYNARHLDFSPFSADRILPNLYFYLFRALPFSSPPAFPFLHLEYYDKIQLPFHVTAETMEPIYGLLTNSPFSLWIFAAPYCWSRRHALSQDARVMTASIGLYGLAMLTLMLFFFFTTMRYAIDFAPWLMYVAAIQYLRVLSLAKSTRGFVLIATAGGLMALYGAFTGTMSGYCGQYLCKAHP